MASAGVGSRATDQPFQRLACGGKTVETVFLSQPAGAGLKPGVNENALPIFAKLNEKL
jgi:hypothetical protein